MALTILLAVFLCLWVCVDCMCIIVYRLMNIQDSVDMMVCIHLNRSALKGSWKYDLWVYKLIFTNFYERLIDLIPRFIYGEHIGKVI